MEQISIRSKNICTKQIFNHLVDPSFQGVNRPFVLSFETENGRTSHSNDYLPKVEIKDYSVMIDGKNFSDHQKMMILKHSKILEKLQQVKEMITQLVVC